jgi:hypothetical protein
VNVSDAHRGINAGNRPVLRRGVATVPQQSLGEFGLSVRQGQLDHDRHVGTLDLRTALKGLLDDERAQGR